MFSAFERQGGHGKKVRDEKVGLSIQKSNSPFYLLKSGRKSNSPIHFETSDSPSHFESRIPLFFKARWSSLCLQQHTREGGMCQEKNFCCQHTILRNHYQLWKLAADISFIAKITSTKRVERKVEVIVKDPFIVRTGTKDKADAERNKYLHERTTEPRDGGMSTDKNLNLCFLTIAGVQKTRQFVSYLQLL